MDMEMWRAARGPLKPTDADRSLRRLDRSHTASRHRDLLCDDTTGFHGRNRVRDVPSQMNESKLSRRAIVSNPQGLHMRPGQLFASLASEFESTIEVINGGRRVDAKSMLDVLTLGAEQGTELEIEASGPDAEAALQALAEFVQRENVEDETADQP
jgi:phosphotransferase system HPr (HPr) family protein